MKTEFNYKIAPKLDGLIGVLRSTSLAFAIVVRDVTARRELDTIKLAINVTWFFPFLIREGTWALQRPVAAFSKKQVWLIMRHQFAYLSWIVEDTNVSMYWSFRVTRASWRQSQRTGLPLPLSALCEPGPLCMNGEIGPHHVEPSHRHECLWYTSKVSQVLSRKTFLFSFLSNRRLILVLVWVLTIIKVRHQGTTQICVSFESKDSNLGHSLFWMQKTKWCLPRFLLTPV